MTQHIMTRGTKIKHGKLKISENGKQQCHFQSRRLLLNY